MASPSSMLLLFGLLLSLPNLNTSTGPKWEDFKRNQVTSAPVITCSVAMQGKCLETQNFIHTFPRILENVCKGVTGMKNVWSTKELRVSTCRKEPNTACTYGGAEVQTGVICLTCRNRKPIQFVHMGRC